MEKLFIFIIVTVVAIFISLPFFRGMLQGEPEEPDLPKNDLDARLKRLNLEKESLLDAIREIDFDYRLGKLSREDFEELGTKYRTDAASVLKEIDDAEGKLGKTNLQEEIEEEIKLVRKSKPTRDRELEEEISRARKRNTKAD